MYKLLAIFGPYLFKLLVVFGGLALLGYFVIKLRLRPYVLIFCGYLLYVPLIKKLSIGFGPGLNPTTFVIAILFVLRLVQPRQDRIQTPLKILLVLWILINIFSFTITSLTESGLYFDFKLRILKRLIDPILLFYFALAIREKNEIRGLITSICGAGVMVGTHAYAQGISRGGRIDGLLEHPNLTMAFLSACAPFILAMAAASTTKFWRIALFSAFYITMMGLFETGSRMGLLAVAVACFGMLLISGSRLMAMVGIVAAVLLMLSPQLLPERIYKRYQDMLGGEYGDSQALSIDEANPDRAVGSRIAIWKGGLRIIGSNPVTGVGFGKFNQEIAPYVADFYGEDSRRSAHNAYIKTAAELGIPALLVLLLIFFQALKQARFVYGAHPNRQVKWIARGAFASTLALILSNMTTASYQDAEVMTNFYVLTAIICVLRSAAISAASDSMEAS